MCGRGTYWGLAGQAECTLRAIEGKLGHCGMVAKEQLKGGAMCWSSLVALATSAKDLCHQQLQQGSAHTCMSDGGEHVAGLGGGGHCTDPLWHAQVGAGRAGHMWLNTEHHHGH